MPDATTKLLPCPFYGSLDFGYSAQDGHDFVVCNNCGAEGPFSYKTGIAAWNQRAIPWQPIETATRDGAKVLTWDGSKMQVAWTRSAGSVTYWHTYEELIHYDFLPTHWQPLPGPPNTINQPS